VSRVIGLVAAQVRPVAYRPEETFAKFEHEIRVLASAWPALNLYVFPELYLTALGSWGDSYPKDYDRSVAETIPGPLTDRIGAVARSVGKWIVAGSIYERVGDDVHNTAIAFSPSGELVGTYRKLYPWMPLEDTTPGSGFCVCDIPDVGRFGLMICYDGWVPEVPRALAWMGAEAILQPTATKTVDREQEIVLARANAIANQVYVVNPNLGGTFGAGGSVIVDPEGRVISQAFAEEAFLTQTIDLDQVRNTREFGTAAVDPLWKQLRDMPMPRFPQYEQGFAAGAVMKGLGPMRLLTPKGNGHAQDAATEVATDSAVADVAEETAAETVSDTRR
jgi:formamidase